MIKGVIKVNSNRGQDDVKDAIVVKFLSDHGYVKVVVLTVEGKFRVFNYDDLDIINIDEVLSNNNVKRSQE